MSAINGIHPKSAIEIYSDDKLILEDKEIQSNPTPQEQADAQQLYTLIYKISDFLWKRCGVETTTIPKFYIKQGKTGFTFSTRKDQSSEFENPSLMNVTYAYLYGLFPFKNSGQAGALNQSLIEITTRVCEQSLSETGRSNWKVESTRDLSQRVSLQGFENKGASNGYGNVPNNSLFLSHCFYCIAKEMEEFDPQCQTLLEIWWKAFQSLTEDEKGLKEFAKKTIEIAKNHRKPFEEMIRQQWRTTKLIH